MPEDSGSRQLLALSEGHVLVRKARKFELQIDPPPPGQIGL